MAVGLSTVWVGAISAIGGVLVTGLMGIGSTWLVHRLQRISTSEDRKASREDARASFRREAYARYFATNDAISMLFAVQARLPENSDAAFDRRMQELREAEPHRFDECDAAASEARMVAGPEVLTTLDEHRNATVMLALRRMTGRPEDLKAKENTENRLLIAIRAEQEQYYSGA